MLVGMAMLEWVYQHTHAMRPATVERFRSQVKAWAAPPEPRPVVEFVSFDPIEKANKSY